MKKKMTPRERFMSAFHLEEPDRVPVTFSYVDPFAELDDRGRSLGFDRFHRLVLETDIVLPKAPRSRRVLYTSSDQVRLETNSFERDGTTYRYDTLVTPKGELHAKRRSEEEVMTTWTYEGFVKTDEDVEKILSIPFDPPEVDMSPVTEGQEMLGERGIVATGLADPICAVADLFTLRDFALTASNKRHVTKKLLDFFAERIEEYLRRMTEQTVDVMYRIYGPEYVTPPILPPKLFFEYVVPYDKKMVDIVKRSGNIACIHCHGRIGTVVEGMRQIDPHVLEPLEPPTQGDIGLRDLKERIGDRICLMGYIQYNDLEFDPPKAIREKVRSAIEQAAPGGGYILFPTAEPIARITDRLLNNQKEFVRSGRDFGKY